MAAITALSALPAATPVVADTLVFNDVSDSGLTKIATAAEVLALSNHFAEIRAVKGFIGGTFSASVTAQEDMVFSRNVPTSTEVAGGPSENILITADQANNKIVIPANTRVFVEYHIGIGQITGTPDVFHFLANLDGTDLDDTLSSAASTLATASPDFFGGTTCSGSGYVDNNTAGPLDLKLGALSTTGASTAAQGGGFLRATWVKDL